MSLASSHIKQYASAQKRLLPAIVAQFFEENFPKLFGPAIRERIAEQLLAVIEQQSVPVAHLRSGQCLWNAMAIETRADHAHPRMIPVVLTLVADEDITQLAAGEPFLHVVQAATARILEEAYAQGALLSMRDLGLLTWKHHTTVSQYRKAWEAQQGRLLHHPGTLQDMGTCVSHKTAIVVKVVYEHHDPRRVSQETQHTQQAVDHYVCDFHRVRTCYRHNSDLQFICQVTGLSAFLVKQYLKIIEQYDSDPLTGNIA